MKTTKKNLEVVFASPVSGPVVRWRAVKRLHRGQQAVTRGHRRRQTDVFGVQRLIVVIFKLLLKRKNHV